jgi:hypothetical protein
MMNKHWIRRLSTLLLAIILLADVAAPLAPVTPAHAQGGPVNAVVGFFRILGAFRGRNRVYREARATQGEMDAYYDALHDKAQQLLSERQMMGTGSLSSEERTQLRVYIKLVSTLEAEREAATQAIEAEKNQARRDFNRRVTNELVGILIKSPGGQRLIGDLRRTVGELRQAAQAVQAAIAGNRPFDALAQALADKASNIPVLQGTAYEIGQAAGHKLDQLLGGVISKVDQAMANMQGGMGDALSEIDKIDGELARLDETERTPVSLVEDGGPLGSIHGVDRANAAADVAAQAYTNAAIIAGALRNPTQADKEDMRSRIRSQLLGERLDRLSRAGQSASHVVCDGVGQAQYIQAMAELGRAPEKPLDPSTARYLVCRERVSGTLVHAALIGGAVAEATTTPDFFAEQTEAPATQEVVAPEEERCSLSGEGDFVIENLSVNSTSSTCEDSPYPFGLDAEPLLVILATAGKWVVVEDTPDGIVWGYQATEDLEGAVVDATATLRGTQLDIDATITVPRSGSTLDPVPSHANGWALAALLPLFPLALVFTNKRKRRLIVLAAALTGLLLTAQDCNAYGSLSGHYTFPIPENGFACEVPADNPNLAEMPGSSGQVSIQITIESDDGSAESCNINGSVTGLGVLKREGFYTEDTFQ